MPISEVWARRLPTIQTLISAWRSPFYPNAVFVKFPFHPNLLGVCKNISLYYIYRALIWCIKYIKKDPQMRVGFMDVILLHSGHRNVSITHVAIFRVVRTRIQISSKQI